MTLRTAGANTPPSESWPSGTRANDIEGANYVTHKRIDIFFFYFNHASQLDFYLLIYNVIKSLQLTVCLCSEAAWHNLLWVGLEQ